MNSNSHLLSIIDALNNPKPRTRTAALRQLSETFMHRPGKYAFYSKNTKNHHNNNEEEEEDDDDDSSSATEMMNKVVGGLTTFIGYERMNYLSAKHSSSSNSITDSMTTNSTTGSATGSLALITKRLNEAANLLKQIVKENVNSCRETAPFLDLVYAIFDCLEIKPRNSSTHSNSENGNDNNGSNGNDLFFDNNEPVCEPLADPLVRTLVSILEVPKHLETLEYQDLQYVLSQLSRIATRVVNSFLSSSQQARSINHTHSLQRLPSYLTELYHAIALTLDTTPIHFEPQHLKTAWNCLQKYLRNVGEEKEAHLYIMQSALQVYRQSVASGGNNNNNNTKNNNNASITSRKRNASDSININNTAISFSLCDSIIITLIPTLSIFYNSRHQSLRECVYTFIQVTFTRLLALVLDFDTLGGSNKDIEDNGDEKEDDDGMDKDIQEALYEGIVALDTVCQKEGLQGTTSLKITEIDIVECGPFYHNSHSHFKSNTNSNRNDFKSTKAKSQNTNKKQNPWFTTKTFSLSADGSVQAWMATLSYYSIRHVYIVLSMSEYFARRRGGGKRQRVKYFDGGKTNSSGSGSIDINNGEQHNSKDDSSGHKDKQFVGTHISNTIELELSQSASSNATNVAFIKHIQFYLFYTTYNETKILLGNVNNTNETNPTDTITSGADTIDNVNTLDNITKIFNSLYKLAYTDNLELSAWSVFAITNLFIQFPFRNSFSKPLVDNLWNLVSQRMYTKEFAETGCFFVKTVLEMSTGVVARNREMAIKAQGVQTQGSKTQSPNTSNASEHRARLEKTVSSFDSSGPRMSPSSVRLVFYLLSQISKLFVDREKARQLREKLTSWAVGQVVNSEAPGKLEKYAKVGVYVQAKAVLATMGISVGLNSEGNEEARKKGKDKGEEEEGEAQFFGIVPYYQNLFEYQIIADNYVRHQIYKKLQAEYEHVNPNGDLNYKQDYDEQSSQLFTSDTLLLSNMSVSESEVKQLVAQLTDKIKSLATSFSPNTTANTDTNTNTNTHNSSSTNLTASMTSNPGSVINKVASNPLILKYIVNCVTAMFIIINSLQRQFPSINSTTNDGPTNGQTIYNSHINLPNSLNGSIDTSYTDCINSAILLIQQIRNSKIVIQEYHQQCLLSGIKSFLNLFNLLGRGSPLEAYYFQMLTLFDSILSGDARSAPFCLLNCSDKVAHNYLLKQTNVVAHSGEIYQLLKFYIAVESVPPEMDLLKVADYLIEQQENDVQVLLMTSVIVKVLETNQHSHSRNQFKSPQPTVRDFEKFIKHVLKLFSDNFSSIVQSETVYHFLLKLLKIHANLWSTQQSFSKIKYSLSAIYFVLDATTNKDKLRITTCIEGLFIELLVSILGAGGNMQLDNQSVAEILGTVIKKSAVLEFYSSQYLPDIFKKFPIQQHYEIFELIHHQRTGSSNFEHAGNGGKVDNVYSLALYLHFLFKLATCSTTFLPQLVYEIVSLININPGTSGGGSPSFSSYQQFLLHSTISKVSAYYNLANPKDLFGKYSTQILLLWMLQNSLFSFPYQLFGYASDIEFFTENLDTIFLLVLKVVGGAETPAKCVSVLKNVANRASVEKNEQVAKVFHLALVSKYSEISTPISMLSTIGTLPKKTAGGDAKATRFGNPLNIYDESQYAELFSRQYISILVTMFNSIDTTPVQPLIDCFRDKSELLMTTVYDNHSSLSSFQDEQDSPHLKIFCSFQVTPAESLQLVSLVQQHLSQDICQILKYPRVQSYVLRNMLDNLNKSIDAIEQAVQFRRIVFFLDWVGNWKKLDKYSFYLLITGLVDDYWESPLVTNEIQRVVKAVYIENMRNTKMEEQKEETFFPYAIQLLAKYFGVFEKQRRINSTNTIQNDSEVKVKEDHQATMIEQIKLETEWLQESCQDLSKYSRVFAILFCWLYNDTETFGEEGLSEDELYSIFVSKDIPQQTKFNLVGVVAIQLSRDKNLQNSLFKNLDIKPIFGTFLRFYQSLKSGNCLNNGNGSSHSFEFIDETGLVNWISRSTAYLCITQGPQTLIESQASIHSLELNDLNEASNKQGTHTVSISSIFLEINTRLLSPDKLVNSKADYCFRVLFGTLKPDLRQLLSKSISFQFQDSLKFCDTNTDGRHVLPNVTLQDLVFDQNLKNSATWIKLIETFLLYSLPEFVCLERLIQADTYFAEQVFPYFVHLFLLNLEPTEEATSDDLNKVLHHCLVYPDTDPLIIELIASTFLYLRKLKLNKEMGGYKYIELNLIDTVSALLRIESFENAYMFMEMHWSACHFQSKEVGKSGNRVGSWIGGFGGAAEVEMNMGKKEQHLAHLIFKGVKAKDMYYASPIEPSTASLMEMASHEDDYNQMLQFQLAQLGQSTPLGQFGSQYQNQNQHQEQSLNSGYNFFGSSSIESSMGQIGTAMSLANNLQRCGLNAISTMVASTFPTTDDVDLYSCAWKLQKWDLPVVAAPSNKNEIAYNLLKHHNDGYLECKDSFLEAYKESITAISNSLARDQSLDADDLESLVIIRECEQVYTATTKPLMNKVAAEQEAQSEYLKSARFDEIEDILLARNIAWRFKLSNSSDVSNVVYPLSVSLSNYNKIAILGSATQKAMTAVVELEQLYKDFEYFSTTAQPLNKNGSKDGHNLLNKELLFDIYNHAKFSLSQTLWKNSHDKMFESIAPDTKKIAVENLKQLFELSQRNHSKSETQLNWAFVFGCQLIAWYKDSGFDRRSVVIDKYLKKVMEYINVSTLANKVKSDLVHSLAEFCLFQYQKETKDTRLDELERATAVKSTQLQVLKEGKQSKTLDREQKITLVLGEKILRQEIAEKQNILKTRQFLLITCARLFLQTAIFADRNGEDVSKFMSVWFDNLKDEALNEAIRGLVSQLPSILLVPWINQLISRLGESGGYKASNANLEQMVVNVCSSHPHHALYQLKSVTIMLENKANSDDEARCLAAQDIWNDLRKVKKLSHILDGISTFAQKAMQVANAKVPTKESKCSLHAILHDREKWWSRGVSSLKIPSPTYHISPRSDCNYSFIPTIVSANDDIRIAGGLSRPKIVKLNLSDGTQSVLLMKGGFDDLRQDAIMEQVFNEANIFFRKYETTRKRKLSIRTYKVIPLGKLGGIIEFVKDTLPLAEYLVGAHKKYYPNAISETTAKKRIQEAAASRNEKQRIDTFVAIKKNIQPVLHMFFMERFFSADTWFASKINYIRSTAAISILGYVLGVGDRHPGNILLDQKTGESVHIDLGIAFDTGRLLPCPETIPFRLTGDIIDGMGICGTTGPFERCCEYTLSVLRDESTSIDTILNVLRHDPLYSWVLSPVKVKKSRREKPDTDSSTSSNPGSSMQSSEITVVDGGEADRVLASVRQKLSREVSSDTTVRNLIYEATDVTNLAVMFQGWAAFF